MNPSATKRSYRSDVRAAQARRTRQAVLAAATELFGSRGWSATGMRDVAQAAGVSVETVYANFSSKANLLKEAIDVALAGDDAPVAIADRAEFAAVGSGTPEERSAAAAALVAGVNRRSAPLLTALRQAAPTDEGLADLLRQAREDELTTTRLGAQRYAGRPVPDLEVHGLRAVLSHEVFLLLTEYSGLSDEQYRRWVAAAIMRLSPTES